MAAVHDLGLTHIALNSSDLDASAAFWPATRARRSHRRDGVPASDKTRL
jgi:hypothetical protein